MGAMNITLCSAFRDSVISGHLERYIEQVWAFHGALDERGDALYCVWGEGDSIDGTRAQLAGGLYGWEFALVDCTHGGKAYGSIENADRFRQLAHVGRCIWAAIPADSDVVVYCESDLVWEPATLLTLIDQVAPYSAISPMVMLDRAGWPSNAFYDRWGAIGLNGRHFDHLPPYNAGYKSDEPFPVSSMGSCMAMRGDLARRLTIDERLFQGISAQIWMMGERVWIDPRLTIKHR